MSVEIIKELALIIFFFLIIFSHRRFAQNRMTKWRCMVQKCSRPAGDYGGDPVARSLSGWNLVLSNSENFLVVSFNIPM